MVGARDLTRSAGELLRGLKQKNDQTSVLETSAVPPVV